jgi:hypothetical protein
MKRSVMLSGVLCLVAMGAALLTVGVGETQAADDVIAIKISPNCLVLDNPGVWVTVHADIAYATVDSATVTLNGIPVKATFADNRGDLVAKFISGDVKDIVSPPAATLTLSGTQKDGEPFSITAVISVK